MFSLIFCFHEYITICVYIVLLMDFCCEFTLLLLGEYLGIELLGQRIDVCLPLQEIISFPSWFN